jgi:hypothetical protein
MQKPTTKQKGIALIIFALILALAATAFLVSQLDGSGVKIERDKKTATALAEAKVALIGWAAKQSTLTQLGQLPCPEDIALIGSATEGTAKSACTLPAIGRLPWRSLGLGDLKDGNGDQLWYAISPGFRSTTINSDTPAQLTVDGVAGSAVAIVFSPGSPLGQTRPIPTNTIPPDVTQYLELSNNDGDNTFVTVGPVAGFNDKLLTISHDELFYAVERRVANEVLNCLNVYASSPVASPPPVPPIGAYPWPAKLNPLLAPAYVGTVNNFFGRVPDFPMGGNWSGSCSIPVGGTGWWLNWKEIVFYALADGYKPTIATPGCGTCLTVSPPSAVADKRVAVLVAGQKLAGQVRTANTDKGVLSNYLEAPNSAGGVSFAQQNVTPVFNDVVVYR